MALCSFLGACLTFPGLRLAQMHLDALRMAADKPLTQWVKAAGGEGAGGGQRWDPPSPVAAEHGGLVVGEGGGATAEDRSLSAKGWRERGEWLRGGQGWLHCRVLLHGSFLAPVLVVVMWIKPISRDFLLHAPMGKQTVQM